MDEADAETIRSFVEEIGKAARRGELSNIERIFAELGRVAGQQTADRVRCRLHAEGSQELLRIAANIRTVTGGTR